VGKVAATLVYVSQAGPFWDLDENGLNITRHKSAKATFEKRIDVFFIRFGCFGKSGLYFFIYLYNFILSELKN
jgi:hypothetical protein